MIRSGLTLLARGAVAGGNVTLRPARGAWRLTLRVERGGRRRIAHATERATLACLDAALASPHTDAAVRRIVDAPLTERAVARALNGNVVDVDGLVERFAERVLDAPELRRMVDEAVAQSVST
jgi:hypothetical protein